jgi:hypothetical protein
MKNFRIRIINRFLAFGLLCLILSCNSQDKIIIETLRELSSEDYLQGDRFIFIVPDLGCSSCTFQAKELYFNHAADSNTYLIFTSETSPKTLKYELNQSKFLPSHVLLDTANLLVQREILEYYPLLLHIRDGKVLFNKSVSPSTQESLEEFEALIRSLK